MTKKIQATGPKEIMVHGTGDDAHPLILRDPSGILGSTNEGAPGKYTKCKRCNSKWPLPLPPFFKFCPNCGSFMPKQRAIVESYFRLVGLDRRLPRAFRLAAEADFNSAIRDALVTFEELVRKKAKLSEHGAALVEKAFSFEYDRTTNTINKLPPISLNNLSTESKRNEQDGFRFLAMGFMRGIRNVFAHTDVHASFQYSLELLTMVDAMTAMVQGVSGSIAEDRSYFRIQIPRKHQGHQLREVSSKPREQTVFLCETCNCEVVARWKVIVR